MTLPSPVVAVTGLNATDNPGPGVAVIRALRADPAFTGSIVGLAYDALDPGLYVPGLCDAAFLVPYPSTGREAVFERLAEVCARVPVDVLMPTLDSELPALLGQEARLEALGVRTFLPARASYDRRSKVHLSSLADAGIPVPPSRSVSTVDALYGVVEALGLPLVLKGGLYGAEVVRDLGSAVAAFHRAASQWGLPVVAQAFIDGDDANVCAVGDGVGGLVGAVAMRKLLLTPTGKGWAGVSVHDPALLALAADVVRVLRWRGPCEVEVRRSTSGELYLIEVNPRFPAWCDLCGPAGQPLVTAAVEWALGRHPRHTESRAGVAFVRASLNQITDLGALGSLSTTGEWHP
ncbi:MAG: carbamoyl-phosphate synthase large subunit [Myxococcota bacterium]|jgi:carbamoyl-phosphate synthase large subunit